MFLVSKVSACFSLNRTSLSYIIGKGYAPCFETVIIVDVKKSYVPFTMNFDEKPLHANGHDSPAEGAKVASRMFIQMRNNGGPLENLTALA